MWKWLINLLAPSPAPTPAPSFRDDFLIQINGVRRSYGKPPFVWSFVLQRDAETNNDKQIRFNKLGHYNYKFAQCAGWGYSNSAQALNGFLADPPHRDILLDSKYTEVGADLRYPWITVSFY